MRHTKSSGDNFIRADIHNQAAIVAVLTPLERRVRFGNHRHIGKLSLIKTQPVQMTPVFGNDLLDKMRLPVWRETAPFIRIDAGNAVIPGHDPVKMPVIGAGYFVHINAAGKQSRTGQINPVPLSLPELPFHNTVFQLQDIMVG